MCAALGGVAEVGEEVAGDGFYGGVDFVEVEMVSLLAVGGYGACAEADDAPARASEAARSREAGEVVIDGPFVNRPHLWRKSAFAGLNCFRQS